MVKAQQEIPPLEGYKQVKGWQDRLLRTEVSKIFGDKTEKVPLELKVEFCSMRFGYMGTSDEDGHLMASANYLKEGNMWSLYLGVIHDLVHVKQFRPQHQTDLFGCSDDSLVKISTWAANPTGALSPSTEVARERFLIYLSCGAGSGTFAQSFWPGFGPSGVFLVHFADLVSCRG